MVKVGFLFDAPLEYSGGLNYIKNLLYALSLVNDGSIRPYVFFSADIPPDVEAQFSSLATVVKTKLLQRGTAKWFVHKVLYKTIGSMILVNALLKSCGIAVLSHVWFVYKGRPPFPLIGWIPDFQYLHLPEFFPTLDPADETRQNRKIIAQSDLVILSSHDALRDFERIAPPEHQSLGAVLQFVSQPSNAALGSVPARDVLERKHGFTGKFFFLPNQFWAHKNHHVVLQAVKILKAKGVDVLVICTGNPKDYRLAGTRYLDTLRDFIETNGLQKHVKLLGHIDYADVLGLMRHSVAVLNPSRFEGWSSSVEEAKSMGKPVVLSRIAVHIEQNPPNGRYFDCDDAAGLAEILADAWAAPPAAANDESERVARDALRERTVEFGRAYVRLLDRVLQKAASRAGRSRVER